MSSTRQRAPHAPIFLDCKFSDFFSIAVAASSPFFERIYTKFGGDVRSAGRRCASGACTGILIGVFFLAAVLSAD